MFIGSLATNLLEAVTNLCNPVIVILEKKIQENLRQQFMQPQYSFI